MKRGEKIQRPAVEAPAKTCQILLSFQQSREFEAEGFSWIFESKRTHKSITNPFSEIRFLLEKMLEFKQFQLFPS